jgi:Mce-associated membrane protein
VDVVAVRPDDLGRQQSPAWSRWLVVPVVATLALAALLVAAAVHAGSRNGTDDVRVAVATAARQEAVNLTTISSATVRRDLSRIIAGATGPLARQFASERSHAQALAADGSRSVGSVLSAGVVGLDAGSGRAEVVVAADAQVTTTPAGTTTPQSSLKHYRMVMQLRRVGGRWLVSDVGFAGVPQ